LNEKRPRRLDAAALLMSLSPSQRVAMSSAIFSLSAQKALDDVLPPELCELHM